MLFFFFFFYVSVGHWRFVCFLYLHFCNTPPLLFFFFVIYIFIFFKCISFVCFMVWMTLFFWVMEAHYFLGLWFLLGVDVVFLFPNEKWHVLLKSFFFFFACRVFYKMSQSRIASRGNVNGSVSAVRVKHTKKIVQVVEYQWKSNVVGLLWF